MRIVVNGEERTLDTEASLADLVEDLGLSGRRIAVELNREIVPRSEYQATSLQAGDQIEVVAAIGGG